MPNIFRKAWIAVGILATTILSLFADPPQIEYGNWTNHPEVLKIRAAVSDINGRVAGPAVELGCNQALIYVEDLSNKPRLVRTRICGSETFNDLRVDLFKDSLGLPIFAYAAWGDNTQRVYFQSGSPFWDIRKYHQSKKPMEVWLALSSDFSWEGDRTGSSHPDAGPFESPPIVLKNDKAEEKLTDQLGLLSLGLDTNSLDRTAIRVVKTTLNEPADQVTFADAPIGIPVMDGNPNFNGRVLALTDGKDGYVLEYIRVKADCSENVILLDCTFVGSKSYYMFFSDALGLKPGKVRSNFSYEENLLEAPTEEYDMPRQTLEVSIGGQKIAEASGSSVTLGFVGDLNGDGKAEVILHSTPVGMGSAGDTLFMSGPNGYESYFVGQYQGC